MSTKRERYEETVNLPVGVEAELAGALLKVRGPLGSVVKDFSRIRCEISLSGRSIIIRSTWTKSKDRTVANTARSLVNNLIIGVTEGFTHRLKVVYSHFPVSIRPRDEHVYVENFYGEKSPRVAKIVGDTKVSAEGDDILVRGLSKEDVGQTAANIERATRTTRRDQRIFLDGVYVYAKERGWKQGA